MVKNRFLLGSVAFGVSFSISLLANRDVSKAIATGLTTTFASVVAAAVADRRSYSQLEGRLATLKSHIRVLQQRRVDAYQALIEIEAEREHLALLEMAPPQSRPLQLPSSPMQLPSSQTSPSKRLSWDLSAPVMADIAPHASIIAQKGSSQVGFEPHNLPTQIQLPQPNGETGMISAEAAEAKRQIEAHLNSLQQEQSLLQRQVLEHRQTRDRLVQDLTELKGQKQQLEAKAKTLRSEIQDLENCRVELEQFLSFAEAKKRELETGSNPLQNALKQLQAQVGGLQEELRLLEAEILERRGQKEALEHQLSLLEGQHFSLEQVPKSNQPTKNVANGGSGVKRAGNGNGSYTTSKANGNSGTLKESKAAVTPSATAVSPATQRPTKSSAVSNPVQPEKSSDLSEEWTELMLQLPEYEFEVLKAIVEQANPAGVIKRIAEENLTMPELLVDSINERSLDTIGDLIVESGNSSSSATIAKDHIKTVKKLIKTYEYLKE